MSMRAILGKTILCAALALTPGLVGAEQIGAVASIEPQMQGQPPGGSLRRLTSGSPVVANERIVTGQNGRGQLLFLDETTLSVASQSDIILDRFVYDPNRGTGEIGLSLTRGALRFIGGRATEETPARIVTPTGTISIRGSSALVLVQNGRTIVVFIAGDRLCFEVLGGVRKCTNRQGGVLGEEGYLGKISQQSLAAILARIDGPQRVVAGQAGVGSGIVDQNPPNRGPLSSRGESYDTGAPGSFFGGRVGEGILPDGLFESTEDLAEDDVMEDHDDDMGPQLNPCDDPSILDLFDSVEECLGEFGLI